MSLSIRILAILLLMPLIIGAQPPPEEDTPELVEFECQEGWWLLGTHCYLFVDIRQTLIRSARFCESYGSKLVYIRDEVESRTIAIAAGLNFTDADEFWIANGKFSADGKSSASIQGAFECRGYWQPSHPILRNDDFMAVSSNLEGRWRIANELEIMPSVCRTPACPKGFFRCGNGNCIKMDWTCDNMDDCMDHSDENNCAPFNCFQHIKGNTGTLEPTANATGGRSCQFIIEGDQENVLKIEFDMLELEAGIDFLYVYVGGATVETSHLLETITGRLPASGKTLYSSNNFFLLKFITDDSLEEAKFRAIWSTVPQLTLGSVTTLQARDTFQIITSPFYEEEQTPTFMMKHWIITAPPGDTVIFEMLTGNPSGKGFRMMISNVGIQISLDEDHIIYISQGNTLTVLIDVRNVKNVRFRAQFKKGCNIESSASIVDLNRVSSIPVGLVCTWNFTNSKGNSFKTSDSIVNSNMINSSDNGQHLSLQYTSTESVDFIEGRVTSTCPEFPDTSHISGLDQTLATIQTISCDLGYEFVQEEYNEEGSIQVQCRFDGNWRFLDSTSFTRFPSCQIVYCGIPDQIPNGRIVNTSGNVTYEATVDYHCYDGFTSTDVMTAACTANGEWSDPPQCIADPCPPINIFANGYFNQSIDVGYGQVTKYVCDFGFELEGAYQTVCLGGSQSSSIPVCREIRCIVPFFEHGKLLADDTSGTVRMGSTITLFCDESYTIQGKATITTSLDLQCHQNGVLDRGECVDYDECNMGLCDSTEVCINRNGTYDCLCKSGYSGDPCSKTVAPLVPENCSFGYSLFRENGQDGFYIPATETGLRDNDVYQYNITCVPIECQIPEQDGILALITAKTSHHYEDILEYTCSQSHRLIGSQYAECDGSGNWVKDEGSATPQCLSLACEMPSNETTDELMISREPGPSANMFTTSCFKGDGTNVRVNKSNICAPVFTTGTNREYKFQGPDTDCQRVDCGLPMAVTGSNFEIPATTYFNDSFEFACDETNGFNVSGHSSQGTRFVYCLGTGRWDFGSLTCLGPRCTDPGFKAGTTYSSPNGFGVNEAVYYVCDNPEYILETPKRICQYDNGVASWNGSTPICYDGTPPQFQLDCPTTLEFNRYDSIILPTLEYSDDSGFAWLEQIVGPKNGSVLKENTLVEFRANDRDQSTICRINLLVKDTREPSMDCVDSPVVINQGQDIYYTDFVTDNNTGPIIIAPNQVAMGSQGSIHAVRASIEKSSGEMTNCAVIAQIAYTKCSNLTIMTAEHASVGSCNQVENGPLECIINCDEGYVNTNALDTSLEVSCTNGIWSHNTNIINCQELLPVAQTVQIEVNYVGSSSFTTDPKAPFEECFGIHENKLETLINGGTLIDGITGDCNLTQFKLVSTINDITSPTKITTTMQIQITGLSEALLPVCLDKFLLNTPLLSSASNELIPASSTDSCRTPWTFPKGTGQVKDPICLNINGTMTNITGHLMCVECGPGMYFNGEGCEICDADYFTTLPGQAICEKCPYNGEITPTKTGYPSTYCPAICPPGFTSSTGYVAAECQACPIDEYWLNAQTCVACPNSGSTKGLEGAIDMTFCYDRCAPGYYSLSGFRDCVLCPPNYYSQSNGSTTCSECPSNTYTISGGVSQQSCLDLVCTDDFCDPAGSTDRVCTAKDHIRQCNCRQGYTGDRCDVFIDLCEPNPCYNEASCTTDRVGFTFTCDCVKETTCVFIKNETLKVDFEAAGQTTIPDIDRDQCESRCGEDCVAYIYYDETPPYCVTMTKLLFDPTVNQSAAYLKSCVDNPLFDGPLCSIDLIDDCNENSCSNMDFCKDLVGGTECVCPMEGGYQGDRCEISIDLCESQPCENSATCVAYDNVRRICFCEPGYTGDSCEVNIDECALNENGCIGGAQCIDLVNGYSCDCDEEYGPYCERLPLRDTCVVTDCGLNSTCIHNEFTLKPYCYCADGFEHPNENTTDMCVAINHCLSDPCQNGAVCSSTDVGFTCKCIDGNEGSLCQHDIDDCVSAPCYNGGVCHDLFQGFICVCPLGYEGTQCGNMTDLCDGQCDADHSLACVPQPNDYQCVCTPGYRGKNCTEQIMMCDEMITCRHGGNCTNLVNDFSCSCPTGWDGPTCEDMYDYCGLSDLCQNQATCINLMDGIFCSCRSGTAGTYCEEKVDICSTFNPFACLHGECSEVDGDPTCQCIGEVTSCTYEDAYSIKFEYDVEFIIGTITSTTFEGCSQACSETEECIAFVLYDTDCYLHRKFSLVDSETEGRQAIKKCQYDPFYSGKSCQLEKNYCKEIESCNSEDTQALCRLDNLTYTCDCENVKNFEGPQCATPKKACLPSTCPAGSSCREYMDPDGYLQLTCQCTPPQVFIENRCKSKDLDFDLFFPPERPGTDSIVSHGFYYGINEGITVSFWIACIGRPDDWVLAITKSDQDPKSGELDQPYMTFSNNIISVSSSGGMGYPNLDKDYNWHFIAFGINPSGQFQLQYDDQLLFEIEDDSEELDIELPSNEYLFVHLGNFNGYMSQVKIWSSLLDINTGFQMLSNKDFLPSPDKLVLGWTAYSRNEYVQEIYPSTSKLFVSICAIDPRLRRELLECPDLVYKDKIPPMLDSQCHPEITLLLDQDEHQTTVRRIGTIFTDGSPASNKKGNVFTLGAHDIAITSTDIEGNIGVCMTRTYVTSNDPFATRPPIDFSSCEGNALGVNTTCPAGQRPSIPVPRFIVAGKLRSYNLDNMFQPPPTLIICGDCNPITFTVELSLSYTLGGTCIPASVGGLATVITGLIMDLSEQWPFLCVDPSCTNVNITSGCNALSATSADATIVFTGLPALLSRANTDLTPRELMFKLVNDPDDLDASTYFNSELNSNEFNVDDRPICSPGHILTDECCVQCGPGSYHDVHADKCVRCPLNSYTSTAAQTECLPCEPGLVTLREGSTIINDCVENCIPGEVYSALNHSCEECPRNFYQDEAGQTKCKPCPAAAGTEFTGSSLPAQCIEYCIPGTQLNGEKCVPCGRGFYRNGEFQDSCQECTGDNTTKSMTSSSIDECIVPICLPGNYVFGSDASSYECRQCDFDVYQNETSQFSCIPCEKQHYTKRRGSSDVSDCIFTCPTGQEKSDGNNCVDCPRNKYRGWNRSDINRPCRNCTDGFITAGERSVNIDQCTIPDCAPGTFLNESLSECIACDYGTFTEYKWQTECDRCQTGFSTPNTSSTSESDCVPVCPEGTEESEDGCVPCQRGYYRSSSIEDRFVGCQKCAAGQTTNGTGATHEDDCNMVACTIGFYRQADNVCAKCPKGEYQDVALQDSCISCGIQRTTVTTGSANEGDCFLDCPEGEQLINNNTCETCERGYYRVAFTLPQVCIKCSPNDMTTDSIGATSQDLCNIPVCGAGYKVADNLDGCEECPFDTFQNEILARTSDTCRECSENFGTHSQGSVSANCTKFCPAGYGLNNVSGTCLICPKGYFNEANITTRFEQCEQCPTSFTTVVDEGASDISQCSLKDCAPGSFIHDNGTCEPCASGTYQPQRSQTGCIACLGDKNTITIGSDDISDCTIFCPAGEEENSDEICVICAADYYKPTASFGNCQKCIGDFTSGIDRQNCLNAFCDAGRESDGNQCQDCAAGFYKTERGNDTCDECPGNFTTTGPKSNLLSDCNVLFCEPGFFSVDGFQCEACHIGLHKSQPGNSNCTPCEENLTTNGTAKTGQADCYLNVCPVGQFRNETNVCNQCEIGFYQPAIGSTSCLRCDEGSTTVNMESDSADDCKVECPAGKQRLPTNVCDFCEPGSYQELPNMDYCDQCPDDYFSEVTGSTSSLDCLRSCIPGTFRTSRSVCTLCPVGTFQDSPDQTECLPCGRIENYDASTFIEGRDTDLQCYPLCSQGRYLDVQNRTCPKCPIGQYKSDVGLETTCEDCPAGNTTLSSGSTNIIDCRYELCGPGFYKREGTALCQKCPIGEFQPDQDVAVTTCSVCPLGKTTLITGASVEDRDCILDCADGEQYDVTSKACVSCGIGLYRKTPMQKCAFCDVGKTTLSAGSSECISSPDIVPIPVTRVSYNMNVTFTVGSCDNEAHLQSVIKSIIRILFKLLRRTYSTLCRDDACDNLNIHIPLYCGKSRGRPMRQRRATAGTVVAEITASDIPDSVTDSTNRYPSSTVLEQTFNDQSLIADTMTENQITYDSTSPVVLACPVGNVVNAAGDTCVLCAEGEYHNIAMDTCMTCPAGSYSIASRLECASCPEGQTTETDGAASSTACDGTCAFDSSVCTNGGACRKDSSDISVCVCTEFYSGPQCQSPVKQAVDDGDDTDIIIGVCIGIGVLLLIILIIVAFLRKTTRPKSKKRSDSDEDSFHNFKMPPVMYIPPPSNGHPQNGMNFDPTMYQNEIVDVYQPHHNNRSRHTSS